MKVLRCCYGRRCKKQHLNFFLCKHFVPPLHSEKQKCEKSLEDVALFCLLILVYTCEMVLKGSTVFGSVICIVKTKELAYIPDPATDLVSPKPRLGFVFIVKI